MRGFSWTIVVGTGCIVGCAFFLSVSSAAAASSAVLASPGAVISFSTYLGGSANDRADEIALDGAGNVYVSGIVGSTNFPGTSSATVTNAGFGLIYVAKYAPNGSARLYTTIIGASYSNLFDDATQGLNDGSRVSGFAVDATGAAYVAAYFNSMAFPASGGIYQRTGGKYLYKLDSSGREIHYAFAFDPAITSIRAIAVDSAGHAYVTGVAGPGLATTPGVVYPNATTGGPFLLKVDPAGRSAVYATYLSQPGQRAYTPSSIDHSAYDFQTTPFALTVDANGNAFVTGQAGSHFGATPGAVNMGDTAHLHTFVAKLNSAATALEYVVRLGGNDSDRGTGIAVSTDGSAIVGGKTLDYSGFPTSNGFQDSVQFEPGVSVVEREIGYLVILSPDGSAVRSASKLAAAGGNLAYGAVNNLDVAPIRVALDANGNIWASGHTHPTRIFPTVAPLQPTPRSFDTFVVKTSPDGRHLLFASFLGGSGDDGGNALVTDGLGNVFIAGYTTSNDFPVAGAVQGSLGVPTNPYAINAFVTKLSGVTSPIVLTAGANPAVAGQSLPLLAAVGTAGNEGTIEFRRGSDLLGSAPVVAGASRLDVVLPAGVHTLTATYRGVGQLDGYTSPVVYEVVNHVCN
ncbi:MAG: SBBP repeat-containing protein [Betaproteobacteria bacterium]|nr:SBBP repeat-containing protein [Betaproteobacteria bacterium]